MIKFIFIITSLIVIIIFIIYYYITCRGPLCNNLVTLSNWQIKDENDISLNLSRDCINKKSYINACKKLDKNIISKTNIKWTDHICFQPCGLDNSGNKSVNIDNTLFISKNKYPCNNEPCDSPLLVNFSNWKKIDENDKYFTIIRDCNNIKLNRNACSKLSIDDISRNIFWSDTTSCSKLCGGGIQNKSTTFNNQLYISDTQFPCNNEKCFDIQSNIDISCNNEKCFDTLISFGKWQLVDEDDNTAIITRTCNNNTSKDICSTLADSFKKQTLNWTGTTFCNKLCDSGYNNKTVVYDGNTFISNTKYPCNTISCLNLVNFDDWLLTSQNDCNGTMTRKCNNNNPNIDACSLIPDSEKIQTIKWFDTTECSGPCNNQTYTKYFIFNNKKNNSNDFPCQLSNCSSTFYLNNFGNVKISTSTLPQNGNIRNMFEGGYYISPYGYYNCNNNSYNNKDNIITIDNNNNIHAGIWIQIEYPTKQIIKRYRFNTDKYANNPAEWVLLASNNDKWILLDNRIINSSTREFTINNNTEYKFYRFVFKKIHGYICSGALNLYNIILYT